MLHSLQNLFFSLGMGRRLQVTGPTSQVIGHKLQVSGYRSKLANHASQGMGKTNASLANDNKLTRESIGMAFQ